MAIDAAQAAEVDQRRFAKSGAGNVRVHVHDVGAERDVDGAGDAGPIGGQDQAGFGVRAIDVRRCAGPAPSPGRVRARRRLRAATAKASAVSRAMPNSPVGRLRRTFSLVLPAKASSKSWMAAEPFMATALMTPRSIQSIRYGAQPVLMTCPPQCDRDGAAVAMGPAQVIASPGECRWRRVAGQAEQPILRAGAGVDRLAEIVVKDLRRPRLRS